MKWFWLVIAVIVAASVAAVLWMPSAGPARESPRPSGSENPPARPDARPAATSAPQTAPAVAPQQAVELPAGPRVVGPREGSPPVPPPPVVKVERVPEAAKPSGADANAPGAAKPAEPAKPAEREPVATRPGDRTPERSQPAPATPSPAPSPPASAGVTEYAIPAHPIFNGDRISPAKAEKRADGVLMLDGRFAIKGSGTEADPYVLPWDLLVSAQETYKPRMGQTRLPQRITMFDGAHVIISGYVAFPLTATDPKEMLMMLNQWDGCCIGVPPTPYDAIEVRLTKRPPDSARLATHGTMRGKFKVEPYEDGGWLLGLYMLEDATLKVDQ